MEAALRKGFVCIAPRCIHPSGMSIVNLGLIQSRAYPTKTEALAQHVRLIRDAAKRGANIICLQELFPTEYFCKGEHTARFDLAEPVPGPTTEALCELARE